jgi:hypothetical protein
VAMLPRTVSNWETMLKPHTVNVCRKTHCLTLLVVAIRRTSGSSTGSLHDRLGAGDLIILISMQFVHHFRLDYSFCVT